MDTLVDLSAIAAAIVGMLLLLLAVLMPVSAYLAQRYAYKCFRELQKMNAKMDAAAHDRPHV